LARPARLGSDPARHARAPGPANLTHVRCPAGGISEDQMSDWTTDAADAIDRSIALVRERTVEPAQSVTRVVVYGLLAGIILAPALVLSAIGAFRGLLLVEQGYTWAAWCPMGGSFVRL